MRVMAKRGSEIIKISGEQKISKVIEPEKNVVVNTKVKVEKKELPEDSIFNKQEANKVEKKPLPSDAIFRKIEPKKDDSTIKPDINKYVTVVEEAEELSVTDELEQSLELEDEEEYDDYEEYDQYLSNRQRSNTRASMKSGKRKHNDDFNGF